MKPHTSQTSADPTLTARGPDAPLRWTINGDFVTLKPTGVARYAWETVTALDALIAEGDPLAANLDIRIVAPRPSAERGLGRIPLTVAKEFDKPRLPQVWAQFQLPRHVAGGLISLCNLGPVAVRDQIICIHDLHTKLVPESYGRAFRLVHDVVSPIVGRRARAVTTVSTFAKETLVRYGVAPADRIVVTYNGHEHALRWDPSRSKLGLGERPFVLTLGRNAPYKNTGLVLRIAAELDRLGLDVYLAGSFDAAAVADGVAMGPNVRLLGRVSDDELAHLLRSALCFLFPSRVEGFGLPALEAMVWGCPLVVSNVASLPEICGETALYVDPDDEAGWVAAVRRLQEEPDLRGRLVKAVGPQARRFSWRTIARTYLALMAGRRDPNDPAGLAESRTRF